jgi:hypothetical protein
MVCQLESVFAHVISAVRCFLFNTMLKFSFTVICLLVFNCFSAFAFDKPELQLTKEIVSQRYCKGDAELDALDLNLKLRFENTGNQPLILYKSSDQIVQQIIQNVYGGNEVNSTLSWMMSGEWKVDESSLDKLFVVLPPNKTYEMQTSARVFVTRGVVGKIAGAVGNGEHFLQIRVAAWHGSQELADNLQQSWKQSGFLWTNSILSLPMKFKVDIKRKLSRCE